MFYFLGQSLLAPEDGIVIVDEPENHMYRAIMGPLWDAIEQCRPDCSFIFLTHDLGFATEQRSRSTYFISSYEHNRLEWEIEELSVFTDIPEKILGELVGSRKPILFVEGTIGSLDVTIYRHFYSDFTVCPIGACSAVIHSVSSFNRNSSMHRIKAKGLVDADERDARMIEALKENDVYVLPVSEIENVLLMPDVFVELAKALHCEDYQARLEQLRALVFQETLKNIDQISCRFTIRSLNQSLARVEIDSKDRDTMQKSFAYSAQADRLFRSMAITCSGNS